MDRRLGIICYQGWKARQILMFCMQSRQCPIVFNNEIQIATVSISKRHQFFYQFFIWKSFKITLKFDFQRLFFLVVPYQHLKFRFEFYQHD